MRGLKIYTAGPMTGYAEFNFPAFNTAEYTLSKLGWTVFNPARKDAEKELAGYATGDAKEAIANGFDFREAFLWDISKVIESDAIYMLRGWEYSPGACAEHATAVAMTRHYPNYQIIYEG